MPCETRSRQKRIKQTSESRDESTSASEYLSDSQEERSTSESPSKSLKRTNESKSPATSPKSVTPATAARTSPSPKTSPTKPLKESTQPKADSPACCVMVVVGIVLIAVLVQVFGSNRLLYTSNSNVNNSCPADSPVCRMEKFTEEFKELKHNFRAQDSEFWKKIKVPVIRVIEEEEPEYPAVLMFVVPKGENTSCTATCLAKQYISKLNPLYTDGEDGYINVQSMSSSSADDMKYQLDNKIKRVFDRKSHKLHTVVIDHIETLDPRVMLLFHGYCDGDHAPYKDAVIILVLHTDLNTEIRGNLDKVVDKYLLMLWKEGLDADKIPPLIARVANNKAMVQDENLYSFSCC